MDIDLEAGREAINLNTVQTEEIAAQSITTDPPSRVRTASERVAEAFSSLNLPTPTTQPSNSEIIQELVLSLKRQYNQRFCWIMVLAVVCTSMAIVCFVILGSVLYNETTVPICIFFGLFLIAGSCFLLMFALTVRTTHSRQPEQVTRGPIRYIMRIEGDQWKRFLNYFYSDSGRPSGVRGCWLCCKENGQRHRQLLTRNYGHIVFGSVGFMVDELFCTIYDRHVVLKVELLPLIDLTSEGSNQPIVDLVMRVWLCRRRYSRRTGKPTPFKVDIFLASEIPSYEIPGIVKYVAIR